MGASMCGNGCTYDERRFWQKDKTLMAFFFTSDDASSMIFYVALYSNAKKY